MDEDPRWTSLAATPAFACELFKSGMTRKQIAHELGVSYDRVKRWIQREARRAKKRAVKWSWAGKTVKHG